MTKGEVIAEDGKTIRHSFDTATDQRAIHIVSAWATSERACGRACGRWTTRAMRSQQFGKLLEMLDVKGRIVTIDAMG